jgi:septum formation protein
MIINDLNKYRIILASKSPRRQELLRELGLKFDTIVREYDERYPENLSGEEIAVYVAREKAKSFKVGILENEIIITADTIVWSGNHVLGKPVDSHDARKMIMELSGNTHEVITGVSLLSSSKEKSFFESTRVIFEKLTDEEINYYIEQFEPYDKAGAYGIQEWIGIAACSRIEGSYFNVVGLPVQRLYKELQEFIK